MSDLAAEGAWPRERVDADYTARACVDAATFERIIGAYAELSRAARALPGSRCDLVYDETSGERLDLFGTAPGEARPVFVFIHGGYWRALSKEHSAFMAPMLAGRGIATAVPDYTLAPKASLTEIVRQMRAALAYLWHNAADLGIDRDRIVVGGSSAGGHLAGALMMTGWQAAFGLPAQPLKAGLPISGLFELAPIAASYVQEWMSLTAEEVERLSPLRHPAGAPRSVVAVAATETAGFHRQTRAYAQAIGAPELTVPGRNHFDIVLDLRDADTALARALLGLF
ncbi:alpha/beta hydrolase [Polymorphum gilvum]|uniref:Alpha/beta hydrolase fold-3 domain protein n=1 Tax=Polymorphum gilvum (strain LMG 25793 / CGMCC 1.9160 / SL003B-26A1) TaxID=991905 RepID=F2IW16_POLGS|nr:alpha/beta hydrolase [Polymorphum gilvum]ADZ70298.1 Alpha/beta hydrolase fold-3 domain protein [Polymorphum gilvum SL003B-26A1]